MQNMAEAGQLHKSALLLAFRRWQKRGTEEALKLRWRRPLRLCASALSCASSGPRPPRLRKARTVFRAPAFAPDLLAARLVHDPEKWIPVFRKDHAPLEI
jgi:hypothetical protein